MGQLFCFSVTHFRKRRGKKISRVNYLWLLYYLLTNQVYLLPLNTLPTLMSSGRLTVEVKRRHLNVSSVLGFILNLSKRFLSLKVKSGGRLHLPLAVEAVSEIILDLSAPLLVVLRAKSTTIISKNFVLT